MSAYVTTAEVIERIGAVAVGQLTTEAGDDPDTDRVDPIVEEANARVAAVVCRRTAIAVTEADHPTTWAFLRGLATAIAVYGVHSLRTPVPADVKVRNDEAVATLKALAAGEMCLPDTAALEGAGADWGSNDPNLSTMREYF